AGCCAATMATLRWRWPPTTRAPAQWTATAAFRPFPRHAPTSAQSWPGAEAAEMAPLSRDPVFGALTRPQMFAGVTYTYFVLNGMVAAELFLVTKSAWALAAAVLIPLAGCIACLKEPRFFDLWLTRISRTNRVANWKAWRCNSYRP